MFTGSSFKPAVSYTLKMRAGKMEKLSQKVAERNRLESLTFFDERKPKRFGSVLLVIAHVKSAMVFPQIIRVHPIGSSFRAARAN